MLIRTRLLAGAAAATIAATTPASAASIVLFNTGVDAAGAVKTDGSTEDHYTATYTTEEAVPVTAAVTLRTATSASGYPIGPWLGDNSLSSWIGPNAPDLDGPAGVYTYTTTFSLAGLQASTARITGQWATDDPGIDILLNGVSTNQTSGSFTSYSPFSLTSGFVAGDNTLQFVLRNGSGPTGLRVEMTGTADAAPAAVPEPATWAMLVLGFGLLGAAARRRTPVLA